jgi:RNA polymerase sigma-70 factor, ECF subfamily
MEGVVHVERAGPTAAEAFEAVVGHHYGHLVRRLTAVVRDASEAEDLAQEAYLRAFRSWHRFDGTDARAWLYTIGLRLAFNERRRRRRWPVLPARAATSDRLRPVDPDLHEALRALRREHRAALVLNVVDGYTRAEIASMLDVPPGTVGSWLERAKAHLREALTDV